MVRGDAYPSIADELQRISWVKEFLPVPKIINFDLNGNPPWLLSEAIAGFNGTQPELKKLIQSVWYIFWQRRYVIFTIEPLSPHVLLIFDSGLRWSMSQRELDSD